MSATAPARASPGDERQDQPEPPLLQHAAGASRPAPSAASTKAAISARNASSPKRSAWARIFSGLQPVTSHRRSASISAVGRLLPEEEPGDAVHDRLRQGAPPVGDDRPAGGRRLERRDPELLLAREEEGPAARRPPAAPPRRAASRGSAPWARPAAGAARARGPLPMTSSRRPRRGARVDRDVDPLVRRQRRTRRGRRRRPRPARGAEERRPHRRVERPAPAGPNPLDAARPRAARCTPGGRPGARPRGPTGGARRGASRRRPRASGGTRPT